MHAKRAKKRPLDSRPDMKTEDSFELRFSGRSEAVSSVSLAMFMSGPFKRRFPVCERLLWRTSRGRSGTTCRDFGAFRLLRRKEREGIFIGGRMFSFVARKKRIGEGESTGEITKTIDAVAKKRKEIDVEQITLRRITSIKSARMPMMA